MKAPIKKKLANGMTVMLLEKPESHHSFIQLTVPFGSTTELETPLTGVAHFIEHMMFQSETLDISKFFVEKHANINAFTTTTSTSYTVLATDDIEPLINRLAKMVLQPQWTAEHVAHEQAIILQEQEMYEDDVYTALMQMSLGGLFPNQLIATDITGTKEDVAKIDLETVQKTHAQMYRPEEMLWVITGNFNADNLFKSMLQLEKQWGINTMPTSKLSYHSDPLKEIGNDAQMSMPIQLDKFAVGVRWPAVKETGRTYIKSVLERQLLTDVLLSPLSSNYNTLYAKGIIDESFSSHFVYEDNFSYLLLMGTGGDEAVAALKQLLKTAHHPDILNDHVFTCAKRELIGTLVTLSDNFEAYSEWLADYHFKEANPDDVLSILAEITLDNLSSLAETILAKTSSLAFKIKPQK